MWMMLNVYKDKSRYNYMLFRDTEGKLVEIRRSHYSTDTAYYQQIMRCKGVVVSHKSDVIKDLVTILKRQR